MSAFIEQIILKMKPNKPKCPSDIEVINDMLSDKFITLHKALIKQGAGIMAKVDELLDLVAKETAEGAALVAKNEFLTRLNAELTAKADEATAKLAELEAKLADGIILSPADFEAVKSAISNIVVAAPVVEPLPAE